MYLYCTYICYLFFFGMQTNWIYVAYVLQLSRSVQRDELDRAQLNFHAKNIWNNFFPSKLILCRQLIHCLVADNQISIVQSISAFIFFHLNLSVHLTIGFVFLFLFLVIYNNNKLTRFTKFTRMAPKKLSHIDQMQSINDRRTYEFISAWTPHL